MRLLPPALISLLPVISAFPSPPQCTTNSVTAYENTTGPVTLNTSPLDPYENIKNSAINETAWEYYYFDSISSDGSAGLAIVFFRDPSLSVLGYGNLRISVDAVWSNGTKFSTMLFVGESSVSTCSGVTKGLWNTTSEGFEFSFEVSETLKTASISLSGPQVSGTWSLSSFAPPRTPDGLIYPSPKASVELAPLIYWNEAIPAGNVQTSFTLAGTPFSFTGIGGHDRNWAPYIWDYIAEHWYWVRIITGPYTLVYWIWTSYDGQTYTSAFVSENGVEVFGTQNGEDVTFTLTYGGKVHGSFKDESTGFVVELEDKSCGKKWKFEIEHANIAFEAPAGNNDAYSRFVNTASGGEVGGKVWNGVGGSEQNVMQEVYPMA